MSTDLVLNPPTLNELEIIHKDLGIDQDKIQYNLDLLKKWLQSESYLPKNIDDSLLTNFLRGCKGNLEKTKQKLEKYFAVKTKIPNLFMQKAIIEDDFILYEMQKCVFISTNYTISGNRIIIFRLPTQDVTYFDHAKIIKYVLLIIEFLLYNDLTSGYDFIYDANHVTGQTISKLNLTGTKHMFNLFYNILPIRTRSLFMLNSNKFFEIAMELARTVMPKKIKDRVKYGNLQDLKRTYPINCLPIEYGGTDRCIDDLSKQYLQLFKNDPGWIERIGNVKMIGQLPEHKKKLYSFDDFNMDGSFRKLNID
ncbi:alpha-tocopherol transfer protein-like [Onthophagus taurus]|uniref:alpha-tocopherol transfer protein-like n=1 Tax=Onthophagus taurus TaxID=166361 RepID=UPI0039BE3876